MVSVLALSGALGTPSASGSGVQIRTLATRADLVSGNDARIEITTPRGAACRRAEAGRRCRLRATVGGRAVTAAFERRGRRRYVGLVTGLAPGRNLMTAWFGRRGARLVIVDHPAGGPLFAGDQVQPWSCTTEVNGLGPPVDAQCDAAGPVVAYKYKNAVTGTLDDYDPADPPPDALVARTTTDEGRTVPYVVRLERGTLDRSIYAIAALADPSGGATALRAWNHKLFVPFGGSCSSKHSQAPPGGIEVSQSAPDGAVLLDQPLSRGFAVATTGLNTLGQDCNPVVSAEALMMLKEHIGDRYGRIRYTMSAGCSGGSVQQHAIADGYPGLLDGIMPSCSFSDLWSPITEVADCALLEHYFDSAPQLWPNPLSRAAVMGSQTPSTCAAWSVTFAGVLDPSNNRLPPTACDVSDDEIYDAERNRGGVRCSVQDYEVAIWGRRSSDGFAKRPLDNVGVQYGLAALESGAITPEQFVDLNEKVGGFDIDGRQTAERMRADPGAVATAYRTDQVITGRQLARVPIIDLRGTGNAEIHTDFWSYATRERLRAANGTAENQAIWSSADSFAVIGRDPTVNEQAFLTMDRWLSAIEADKRRVPLQQKVLDDRVADATDACFVGARRITDARLCTTLFPHYANPRIEAGGPLASDVLKCTLKPLRRSDYRVAFTDGQWSQLSRAFPSGVCDFSSPAAERQAPMTWPTFDGGPGGRPLGPAPRSVALRRRGHRAHPRQRQGTR